MFQRLVKNLRSPWRQSVEVLTLPYPFSGMVAINSDVEFTSWRAQLDLADIFAVAELETAFSFWVFGRPSMGWSLLDWSETENSESIAARRLIRAGLLDTLHSFADRSGGDPLDRDRIERGLAWLSEHAAVPLVYTNHGGTDDKQNVAEASFATYQEGDLPGSRFHHLDLSVAAGLRFCWTDVDYSNDQWSFKATTGQPDSLFVDGRGRDGTPFLRFRRYRGPLSFAPTATSFAEQLRPILNDPPMGYCVIYQHLGCHRGSNGVPYAAASPYFDNDGERTLQSLSALQRNERCLFTTTSRLLRHAAFQAAAPFTIDHSGDRVVIKVNEFAEFGGARWRVESSDIDGFGISLKREASVHLVLSGKTIEVPLIAREAKMIYALPWSRRNFRDVIMDARGPDLEGAKCGVSSRFL
jgi:hypothetical protein